MNVLLRSTKLNRKDNKMSNEKFENLKQELYKQANGSKPLLMVSDFIVWALERGNHEDIADMFFSEDKKTKKSLINCMNAARDAAQKQAMGSYAMVEDCDVYMSIAKHLGLEDCITMEEIKHFTSGNYQVPAAPVQEEPPKPAVLDLGLDDLFG